MSRKKKHRRHQTVRPVDDRPAWMRLFDVSRAGYAVGFMFVAVFFFFDDRSAAPQVPWYLLVGTSLLKGLAGIAIHFPIVWAIRRFSKYRPPVS